MSRALHIALFAALLAPPSAPQVVEIHGLPQGIVIGPDGVPIAVGGAGGAPASPEGAAAQPSPRQQKLQALVFDRRPSAILRAWSSEPPEPPEKPEELIEAEEAAGTGESAAAEAPPGGRATPGDQATGADGADADGRGRENDDGASESGGGAEGAKEGESANASEDGGDATENDEADAKETEATAEASKVEEGSDAASGPPDADAPAHDGAPGEAKPEDGLGGEPAPQAPDPEAQARAAKLEAARAQYEQALLDHEIALFQRDVTLGRWDEVRAYLETLTDDERKVAYTQLLKSLNAGPPVPNSPLRPYAEKNRFTPEDVCGIAGAAPVEIEDAHLENLGGILSQCVDQGHTIEAVIDLLATRASEGAFPLDRRKIARLLFAAHYATEAAPFLPSLEEALANDDRDALNLLARHFLALDRRDGTHERLEDAWRATQGVLAAGEVTEEEKAEALRRAVDIAPLVRAELGDQWLRESFTERVDRGREILAAIGSANAAAMMAQASDPDGRLQNLALQTTAANALVEAAPERAREWRRPLQLLAENWLREAQHSYRYDRSTGLSPRMQRDVFGNFFYFDFESQFYNQNRNMPQPIPVGKLIEHQPGERWLELLEDSLRPAFHEVLAKLLLKVDEAERAFPHIEHLAQHHKEKAEELVDEFLRVWARNHNPNDQSRNRNYVYIYGFEERASAIPLTRSKQERNLKELAEWIRRLRALPLDPPDEDLLAEAFVAAHSVAEVYRIESFERVFGSIDDLEPETLAELIQRMRTNLVGVWRDPNVQKDNKTKRRQKDIQNEILRGYEVARQVLSRALSKHPDHWALRLAHASVLHDENNYRQEIQKSPEFSARRKQAFSEFEEAARLYAAAAPSLGEDEESTKVYETWFYAALGACDLGAIDAEMHSDERQFPRIKAAIDGLGGDLAERHRGRFASQLFTRMGSVNPAVKFRYVRAGLQIAGDHEAAGEAREVYEYYRDLVTEIRLEALVDGSPRVGQEPFGLLLNIHHTKEIERESGGFSKYLTNQNTQGFSYNYGRPTEDYRDKFEEAARETLSEHFEVLSVTFNHPSTHSRAAEEYGWRITPYCYVLLRARGPEVDRVPSLRLDLDFLDTSGYAVLPIESPAVAISAADAAEPRPYRDVEVTQTLDERQARDGKLLLEIKAVANGLVPDLEQLLDVGSEGFEVASIEDQGVSVVEFDEESEEPSVRSERLWTVAFRGREDLEQLPERFTFARPRVELAALEHLRFVDADLESVESEIPLVARYGREAERGPGFWIRSAIAALLVAGLLFVLLRRRRAAPPAPEALRMPDEVTPFTVLGLLRAIESRNGIHGPALDELRREIAKLERAWFGDDGAPPSDPEAIARTWIERAGGSR